MSSTKTAKTACFFSHEPKAQLQREQYSIQDIRILGDLGFDVTIATSFREVPWGQDLYFSWWASGSILPLIKALLSGRPIIVVAGGNDSTLHRDSASGAPLGYLAAPWYKRLATRLSLRWSTAVLVVSHHMVNDVLRLGARRPLVVPNSVDVDVFAPSDGPRTLVATIFGLSEPAVANKRAEVFIRSIPFVLDAFPEQTFAIIGEKGDAYPRLHALAVHLGVDKNLDFVGSITNTAVVGWLQRCQVYVQISDTETFGVAIAEAMSTGTQVVVSRTGAVPALVGDCGVFVDHNDPKAVAEGIVHVLSMTAEERLQRGRAARGRIVERFSFEGRKAAIREVIEALGRDLLPRARAAAGPVSPGEAR